jgi:hypothetical protein
MDEQGFLGMLIKELVKDLFMYEHASVSIHLIHFSYGSREKILPKHEASQIPPIGK